MMTHGHYSTPYMYMQLPAKLNTQRYVLLEDLLEDVLEPAVVALENRVLGAHVERPLLLDRVLHAAVSEALDRLQ